MEVEINATPDRLRLSVPIEGPGFPRPDQRHIVLVAETVARHLGRSGETLSAGELERFGRENTSHILRRAIEVQGAKEIIGNAPIDAPKGRIADFIFLWPNEF